MLVYPQLSNGAVSQFPVRKRVQLRTLVNRAPDGSSIKAPDPGAAVTEWALSYRDLTDAEAATLEEFFLTAEGRLNSFTFLDPVGNLFSRSDQLDNGVWEKDPMLAVTGGADDPRGSKLAWHLKNSGAAGQALTQTLNAPAGYLYCLSAYVMAPAETTLALVAGNQRCERTANTSWSRITFATTPDEPRFGIEVPAGADVEVFGLQVEPQPSASEYRSSTDGGVYESARLKDDALRITSTGFNRHSCTVHIIHANHL